MPAKVLETRPGRSQLFFQLLQDIILFIMGPTASFQATRFERDDSLKQVVLAAIAIYAEAALVALIHFLQTLYFWYLYRNRTHPRPHTRRLRGIRLSNLLVPLSHTHTNTQIISPWNYVRIAISALILACVIGVPSIIFGHRSFSDAEGTVLSISLFLLITIGTGGNILAGLIFFLERLDNEGVIQIRTRHVRVVLPVFYSCWLLFQSVVFFTKITVYSSSNPCLRALARVHLLPVTVDVAVSANKQHSGRIDEGKLYINLRQSLDSATVTIGNERETQEIAFDQISRMS